MLITALIHMLDTRQTDRRCVIAVTAIITVKMIFPHGLTIGTAHGLGHGISHETPAIDIKQAPTSSARCLTSAFCMWGPEVAMVPGPAFACEQLRQPSGVSHTHNRKTRVVLLNRFSLLPSWFREGCGDVQTQHTNCEQSCRPEETEISKFQPNFFLNNIQLLCQY